MEDSRIVCYDRRHGAGSHLVGIDLASGAERVLIGIDGAQFGNLITRPSVPSEVLVSLKLENAPEERHGGAGSRQARRPVAHVALGRLQLQSRG